MPRAYRTSDDSTSDRPDWSAMLPFIKAGRAALVKPGQLRIAERNRVKLGAAFPDVDLTKETALHGLMVRLVMVAGSEVAVLSLIPLIPEDVR